MVYHVGCDTSVCCQMMTLWTVVMTSCLVGTIQAVIELPKFSQLTILYPGYYKYQGEYRDHEIIDLITVPAPTNHTHTHTPTLHTHDTASLRLSWTLNAFGGRHAVGVEPVFLSKQGRDSVTGADGQQYIFRNTAFGPFLAKKYGNPLLVKPASLAPLQGKQGIVRVVSYKNTPHHPHPTGHVGLWDCNHFHQSRNWFLREKHLLIAVELWETPDSYCPPKRPEPQPTYVVLDKETTKKLAKEALATRTLMHTSRAQRHHHHQRARDTHTYT